MTGRPVAAGEKELQAISEVGQERRLGHEIHVVLWKAFPKMNNPLGNLSGFVQLSRAKLCS
jgi:hypothetical protein